MAVQPKLALNFLTRAHPFHPALLFSQIAETEHRILKKATETKDTGPKAGATAGLIKKKVSGAAAARALHVDDAWKADFRAYLFRLPAYYLPAVRRALRPLLPPGAASLLHHEGHPEALSSLCFSPACLLKIQQGEKAAEGANEWLRGMEYTVRRRQHPALLEAPLASEQWQASGRPSSGARKEGQQDVTSLHFGHGQCDQFKVSAYLSSLRNAPPPWKNGESSSKCESDSTGLISLLPSSCLLSYYESRRRWIFGGSGQLACIVYVMHLSYSLSRF